MRNLSVKIISTIMAAAVLFTSIDVSAFAAEKDKATVSEVNSGDLIL